VVQVRVRIDGHPGRFRLVGLDLFAEAGFREALPGAIQGQAELAEWLTRPDALVLTQAAADDLGLAVGDRVEVRRAGIGHPLEVLAVHPGGGAGSRDLLLVDIATAQAIADTGDSLSHVDLVLDLAARAWLEPRLPDGVRLVDVLEQTEGTAGLSSAFELNLTAMSLLALLVGVFLIYNAIGFSVVQRRPLLGRLRAIGVTGSDIQRLILLEALVLGLLGTLAGALLGIWLGQGLTRIVAATVSALYYEVSVDALHLSWTALLKAALLGLGGTVAAAWLPARQAARTPPLTTLSRAALEQSTRSLAPPLALAGLALLVLGLLAAFHLPGGVGVSLGGLFLALLGAAMLVPSVLRLGAALLALLPLGRTWAMATRDLDRHLSRLATAAAALAIALSASVGVAIMVESMRDAVDGWLTRLLPAELYIAAEGFEDGAALPREAVRAAQGVPGVAALSRYRDLWLTLPDGRLRLVAADLAPASRDGFELLRSLPEPWARFDAGAVLISEPLANRRGLAPGELLTLATPRGERAFPVAAVFRDYASEHGRVFMPLTLYRETWSDERIDSLALFAADGDAEALYRRAHATLTADYPVVLTAAGAIHAESMAVFDRTFRITGVLRQLALLVAVIGVFSALMAIQLERRREFAVLRALGTTRAQLGLLVVLESALLGLFAGLLALPTGAVMAWVLTDAVQLRAFGWSMPFQVPPLPLLLTLVSGLGAAVVAGLYPAWRAGWRDPAPMLRDD
jgi:putative ABC transport system permease protein